MQNLDKWIEAQLKKGYRKEQIKRALIRKGYPPEAVAEVDKIAYAVPSARTLPGKKIDRKISSKAIALISIVIGIIVLVWVFNALPFSSKQASGDVIVPEQKSAEQIGEEKIILQEFLQESLKEDYYPASLVVEKIVDETNKTIYLSEWTSKGTAFYTSLQHTDNAYPNVVLTILQPKIADLNEKTSLSIAGKFFKFTEDIWKCRKVGVIEVCESFWIDKKDKKGVGIRNTVGRNTSFLYACKIPFGSNKYGQDSCLTIR